MATNFDQTGFSEHFADNSLFGPFVSAQYDNLDHGYFARKGFGSKLSAHWYFDPKNKGNSVKDVGISYEHYITPNGGRFSIIPQIYSRWVLDDDSYANMTNVIGGEVPGRHFDHQMPFVGVSHLNEVEDFAAIVRCDLRYNLIGKHYITGIYNILFGCDFMNQTDEFAYELYSGAGLRYSYNTPIGPLSLTAQWSDCTHQFSMYFSLGYNF